MTIYAFLNPQAGSVESNRSLRRFLDEDPRYTVRELGPDDDLGQLIAAPNDCTLLAVAGGDGTVHAAANGLLKANSHAAFGIIPLGTGNDFCRTLAIPLDPMAAASLLQNGTPRDIDAIRIEGDKSGYLLNAATGGFSGQVASQVTSEQKAAWGPLAYLRGALGPIADLPRYRLTIRFDRGEPETFDALNIVVANGRMAAGGIPVAPTANPEDGKFDVVIVPSCDALDLTVVAARLLHGDYLGDENVVHRLAERVEIESDPPISFSIDGELCQGSRFTFSIVPKALRIVVGADYRPNLVSEPGIEDEPAEDSPAHPQHFRKRIFGLLAGILLVVKRMPRSAGKALALIAVAVLLFAWITRGVVAGDWRERNEAVLRAWHERGSPDLDRLAIFLTWFGGTIGTVLVVGSVLALFLWRKHYLTAGTLVASVVGVLILEAVLKPLFGLARPNEFLSIAPATGFSFPSGHALRAVGVYGLLAALALSRGYHFRRPVWWVVAAMCAALAVGICWSRVYLGVHWLSDVIAGALAATAWVATCLTARYQAMNASRVRAR